MAENNTRLSELLNENQDNAPKEKTRAGEEEFKLIVDSAKFTLFDKKNESCPVKMLNLNTFKTKKCTNNEPSHSIKMCSAYHEKTKDKRRQPCAYKSELCSIVAKKKWCPQGD